MSTSSNGEAPPFLDSVLMRMNGFLYRCRADKEFTMLELTSGFERIFGHDCLGGAGQSRALVRVAHSSGRFSRR